MVKNTIDQLGQVPIGDESQLVHKGRALVIAGRRKGEIEGVLREFKEERLDSLAKLWELPQPKDPDSAVLQAVLEEGEGGW